MTKIAEQVLKEALALDSEDLADLIDELIVRGPRTDLAYTQAWEAEIRKRLEEIDSGSAEMIPLEEALDRIQSYTGDDA